MISFSFVKKTLETKKKEVSKIEDGVEIIRNFSGNKNNSDISENKIVSKRKRLIKTDFKDFKDEEISSNVAINDVFKSMLPKLKQIDSFEFNVSNDKRIKSENSKKNIYKKPKMYTILKIGDFCKIIHGKNKGDFGQLIFISDDEDRIRILLYKKGKFLTKRENIEKIKEEKYNECIREYESRVIKNEVFSNYKQSEVESMKSEKESIEENSQLNGCLYSGLHVHISDKKYHNGKYAGDDAVIEDVQGIDECSCLTSKGIYLENLSSDMFTAVRPTTSKRAIILGGPQKGKFVTVLEINESTAVVQEHDNIWDEDIKNLCKFD